MSGESDIERLRLALGESGRFVYRHLTALVGVSIAWFVASIPLVTLGPATVGAYAAIRSLRETGHIDRGGVVRRVRATGIHAFLLSLLPVVPASAAALYAVDYLGTGSTASAALTVVCTYVALYGVLILVPAFVALSGGATVFEALRGGYAQTTGHPTLMLTTVLLTGAIVVATAALTIAFVVLFPTLAFSLHHFLFGTEWDRPANERRSADQTDRSHRFPTEI